MFKKIERLNRAEFTEFFKRGRRFQSPTLTLVFTPKVPFKVSIVVGKKVSKSAVERNRTRRRLYASLARFKEENAITEGVCIVIAKPQAARCTRADLMKESTEILRLAYLPKAR
jgi:ribonuclease P protein component